ncbi:hypothetical protein DPMN_189907 [Dreissena polymorpha]|uniref:Uncharacterized protein n=1 Tax=Dreissena polymorpha TaxID=45954 RepID=A0A9D4ICM3_DREPO|nr:hypothetical protein DPMN_189907 [Dreissena polymorpha]
MSSVRLGFHFCCPLDNYFNPSHFHLDNNEASTVSMSGSSNILAIHRTLFPGSSNILAIHRT